MASVKTEILSQQADNDVQRGRPGWSPLDCLRSLGRAASIASGADSRGFRADGAGTAAAAPGPAALGTPKPAL